MSRLSLLLRSLRHTRPEQIAWRAWLTAKRRARVALTSRPRAIAASIATSLPACAPDPPPPVFPPRAQWLPREDGRIAVRFFEQTRELEAPVDWHPTGLAHNAPLWKMHLHLMEYLEGLDDASFARTVDDWIARNPPYRPGYWLYDWNSFTVSIRCVVWMQQLAARGARIPSAARARMLGSLAAQIRFLAANLERDLGGNHLLKDVKALVWAGAFFRGAEAEAWTSRGLSLLRRELETQILADGMHYERSASYHAQVFADLLECRSVLAEAATRAALDRALAPMAQVLADLTHPDGGPSLFNDAGLHSAYSARDCLAAWQAAGSLSVSPRASFALGDAGYFGVREGNSFVLADCGPIAPDELPAHGHGDILAFEWTLRGRRIVVDAGVFEYAAGAMRRESRATRSHNTVTVADADQCEFWSSFRVGRRARVSVAGVQLRAGGFTLEGSHDGFRALPGSPVHRRRIEAAPERVEVSDVVEGGAGQPVAARLLFHPDCSLSRVSGGIEIVSGPVRAVLETPAPIAIEEGAYCPDFGVRLAAPRIVLDYGPAPCRGGFVLLAR